MYTCGMTINTTSTLLTPQETARRLGVSERRVGALCEAGELHALASGRRGKLIKLESVQHYSQWSGSDGRPYSAQMAFAALYLISGEETPWLSTQQRYRLKRYLCAIDAVSLATRCRRRARLTDFWCRTSMLASVATRIRISAGTGELAIDFGLSASERVEGYVSVDDAKRVIRDCRLKQDFSQPNVRLRVARFLPPAAGAMPVGVCAADLAESIYPRERRVGMETLDHLISAFQRKVVVS